MKLKNKLDTNHFFTSEKNDNKEFTSIYIQYFLIFILQYEKI